MPQHTITLNFTTAQQTRIVAALKSVIADEMGPSYDENGDEIVPTVTGAQAMAWLNAKVVNDLKEMTLNYERQEAHKAALAAVTIADVVIT